MLSHVFHVWWELWITIDQLSWHCFQVLFLLALMCTCLHKVDRVPYCVLIWDMCSELNLADFTAGITNFLSLVHKAHWILQTEKME
jgi:hypothetical protein